MTAPLILSAVLNVALLVLLIVFGIVQARPKDDREDVDPFEFTRRAEGIQIRFDRCRDRAEKAAADGDMEALEAASAESELLLDNMRELRLEQLTVKQRGWKR